MLLSRRAQFLESPPLTEVLDMLFDIVTIFPLFPSISQYFLVSLDPKNKGSFECEKMAIMGKTNRKIRERAFESTEGYLQNIPPKYLELSAE